MYQFLTLSAGILISLIALINGTLTAGVGLYLTTVIIHIVAIISAFVIIVVRKQKILPRQRLPLWMYSAGLISVLCTLCSNSAYGKISLVAITAIGLLAQTVTSLVIDCFGLLGAKRHRIQSFTMVCVVFSLLGIIYMLKGAQMNVLSAVITSYVAGMGLVISRMISASLAEKSGAIGSSLINHLVGLPLALLLLFVISRGELLMLPQSLAGVPLWAYTGGVAGMLIIVITNIVLHRVSAFQVSVLLFIGQVFSGAAIDVLMGAGVSMRTFIGGVIISMGVLANTLLQQINEKRKNIR